MTSQMTQESLWQSEKAYRKSSKLLLPERSGHYKISLVDDPVAGMHLKEYDGLLGSFINTIWFQ